MSFVIISSTVQFFQCVCLAVYCCYVAVGNRWERLFTTGDRPYSLEEHTMLAYRVCVRQIRAGFHGNILVLAIIVRRNGQRMLYVTGYITNNSHLNGICSHAS